MKELRQSANPRIKVTRMDRTSVYIQLDGKTIYTVQNLDHFELALSGLERQLSGESEIAAHSGAWRWIDEASKVMNKWRASVTAESDEYTNKLWEETDSLLSGVPCPQEDLGFNSPADKAARSAIRTKDDLLDLLEHAQNDRDRLQKELVDLPRLREIEHRIWHCLDDSEQRDDEIVLMRGHDYDELIKLLPEDHPRAAAPAEAGEPVAGDPEIVSYVSLPCPDDPGHRVIGVKVLGTAFKHSIDATLWLKRKLSASPEETAQIERAFQMLEACGVPRERAKTVANGIDVLATRLNRDEFFTKAMEADAARYRWLRDKSVPPHNFYISVPEEFKDERYKPHDVDAAIDACIATASGTDMDNSTFQEKKP